MYHSKKYCLGLFMLLLLASCANSNFEWIKVNPDKANNLVKPVFPEQSAAAKQVNINISLKERGDTVYQGYTERPDRQLAGQQYGHPKNQSAINQLNNSLIFPLHGSADFMVIPHTQKRASPSLFDDGQGISAKNKKKNVSKISEEGGKGDQSRNLIWIGFALIVLGLLFGLILGRTGFFIALAGVVFAMVGFFVF